MHDLDALIEELTEFRRLRNVFNPFIVLGSARLEETHNRMLAWLLDPHGSHNLGDFFAQGLLPPQRASADFSSLKVRREKEIVVTVKGKPEKRRIDVLATLPKQQVAWLIELKTYSGEHDDQLKAYRTWFENEDKLEGYTPHYIYLTRYADPPKSDPCWQPVGYDSVIEILMARPQRESAADAFISDYVDAMQRWFALGAKSQEQGMAVLSRLDWSLSGFPPGQLEGFKDEYESLRRLLKRIEEARARAVARPAT